MTTRRLLAYVAGLALMTFALVAIERFTETGLRMLVASPLAATLGTSEYSVVEWLQIVLLVVVAGLSWWAAQLSRIQRTLATLGFAVACAAIIREFDLFLDRFLFDHAWQLLVAIVGVAAIVSAVRHRRALVAGWTRALGEPGLGLIVLGISIVTVFANALGNEGLWQSLMGDDYVRVAKVATEELTELAGYWLWLVGQIEFTLSCKTQHRVSRDGSDRRRSERRRRRDKSRGPGGFTK
ncbi:MAG: hypothetical protein AAGM16_14115 [Pseudomonadota bacterium]